jgi:hypothetical protein
MLNQKRLLSKSVYT